MKRLDLLRISLLASLAGCSTGPDDAGSEGNTTTSMGSATESASETEAGTETETETGGDVCEAVCDGATTLAEGIVACPDGRINRIGGGTFDPTNPAAACEGTEDSLLCTTDAECTDGEYGKCTHHTWTDEFGEMTTTSCACTYSCATDSDCDEGSICVPPNVLPNTGDAPICHAATCTSNADCEGCAECGLGAYDDGCGYLTTIECRTPADACSSDADCADFEFCFPDPGGTWICQGHVCDIGRPLLVAAVARTAASRRRVDWADMRGFEDLHEDPELAAHWTMIAALEHASIASFARFGAQLMALGAPPELLRASKQAARDEVEHARLAYGLASAYGNVQIGPGQLDLRGVMHTASWREVVGGLIEEACVGETLGVAEAIAAAEAARVPAVRAVLERIAADEQRHAQLAWRSLAWLLREVSEVERAWAQALLERTISSVGKPSGASDGLHRPADGVLGAARRAQVHRAARSQVLAPLAQALRSHARRDDHHDHDGAVRAPA
jgi:hypothetical protein